MPGQGRLPGPLMPQFPENSFRLMVTPAYKVTPPASVPCPPTPVPTPPANPLPAPPSQDDPAPTGGWSFNPLDTQKAAQKVIQDTFERKLDVFPPGSCQPLPPTPNPPAPTPTPTPPGANVPNDDPQWVVQAGDQSTRHLSFPHATSYGQVLEHALVVSAGRNWPLHPKGRSGLEFQVAVAFLYDMAYQNDFRQGMAAYLDHSPAHRPINFQLIAQLSYLWPFFLNADNESIVDLSVLGQLVPDLNRSYDYDAQKMKWSGQMQVVLGATITIKPFAHTQATGVLSTIKKGFFISFGPQAGVTGADTSTIDLSGVGNVGFTF